MVRQHVLVFIEHSANTDTAFLSLTNYLTGMSFTGTSNARTWLVNNLGYYTNYPSAPLSVNDFYQGGIVGYIFVPGQPRYVSGQTHGIIVDRNNYGTRTQGGSGQGYWWGCSGNITGLGEVVGSGYTNQQTILTYMNANCPSTLSGSGFNYVTGVTTGGYTDWFVPNLVEFNSVLSGTGTVNLVNFSGYSTDNLNQAYVTSFQNSNTTYRVGVTLLNNPPLYKPVSTYNADKTGVLDGGSNIKLFRYF